MRNWLEKMHSLSASMLFAHGYVLPFEKIPPTTKASGRKPDQPVGNALRRCADACRSMMPRLIQPH